MLIDAASIGKINTCMNIYVSMYVMQIQKLKKVLSANDLAERAANTTAVNQLMNE